MGDIPLCWCGKPSRDPKRYDWCGKCKTPSDPEIASAWQNRRELVEQRDSYKAKAEEWQARAEALAGVLREIAKPVDCPADEVALWDELSAKAALNAYDAANTSEGSGEALPPPQAEGSSPEAPEPLRSSLPGIADAVKREVAEALRIVVREHDGKRTTMAQALRELADLLCPST